MDERLVEWLQVSIAKGEALIVWTHPETPFPFSDELKAEMVAAKMEFRTDAYIARDMVLFQMKDDV